MKDKQIEKQDSVNASTTTPLQSEPAEMEEWMNTWKLDDRPIDRLNYSSALLKRRWTDYGTIAFLMAGVGGLVWLLVFDRRPLPIFMAAFFIPYLSWVSWTVWKRVQQEVSALPDSSRAFIEAIDHNLVLRERESKWERHTFPLLFLGMVASATWQSIDGLTSGTTYLVWGLLLSIAIWSVYWSKPKSLRAERDNLSQIKGISPDR